MIRSAGKAILCALFIAALACAIHTGEQVDYPAYSVMWRTVLAGRDPWEGLAGAEKAEQAPNTYGPLFNALALPAALHPLLPKLLFVVVWFAIAVRLLRESAARASIGLAAGLVGFLLLNPYFWIAVPVCGFSDIVVAATCLLALSTRLAGRDLLAGAWLGAGILLKFYPAVLLPVLMMDGRRIRWRVAVACGLIVGAGLATSTLIWGTTWIKPLFFAAGRRSRGGLTVFLFLRSRWSPLPWFGLPANADRYSMPCIVVANSLLAVVCRWKRLPVAPCAVLALIVTLTFYKLGHPHFYMPVFVLAACWYCRDWLSVAGARGLHLALGTYFGWLAALQIFMYSSAWDRLDPDQRSIAGLVNLPLALWAMGAVLCWCLRREAAPPARAP